MLLAIYRIPPQKWPHSNSSHGSDPDIGMQHGPRATAPYQDSGYLGFVSASAFNLLCDLEQVTSSCQASVSHSVK